MLMSVQIRKPLVLLTLLDGADPKDIKRVLKATDADLWLEFDRMRTAVTSMRQALADQFAHFYAVEEAQVTRS